jgi:glycine cleavage system H lipoate-binding protein
MINKDPYGKGWLARIKASKPAELNELLKPGSPEFAARIAAERAKYKK